MLTSFLEILESSLLFAAIKLLVYVEISPSKVVT